LSKNKEEFEEKSVEFVWLVGSTDHMIGADPTSIQRTPFSGLNALERFTGLPGIYLSLHRVVSGENLTRLCKTDKLSDAVAKRCSTA
jgi:hypothetical protein